MDSTPDDEQLNDSDHRLFNGVWNDEDELDPTDLAGEVPRDVWAGSGE